MQRLIVGALRLHPDLYHLLKGKLDASLDHCNHKDCVVKVFLLLDLHVTCWRLLKPSLSGFLSPLEQIHIILVPICHHRFGEHSRDDVILVLGVQRLHDRFELLGQFEALQLRGIVQAVHHAGYATVLQGLGDCLPTKLDELGGIRCFGSIGHHLFEAQDGTCLQHAAQDCLLAHKVTLHLCNEGAEQHASAIAARRNCIGLREVKTIGLGIILRVHCDQGGNAKAALVLLADFGTRALRRHHDDGQVLADLHAFLHNVEPVAVRKAGALLHHGHD
mmetsp:Transcript_120586/g.286462  ORF Transcript_120586/g.286462 Transcript_120586/m.286462 type:complete len:276 (-) Transcript_120586:464-1291(-)